LLPNNPVHFRINFDGVSGLEFAGELINFIEIVNAFETGDFNLRNIADGEISVQTIFERKILRGDVQNRQFQGQLFRDRHAERHLCRRPARLSQSDWRQDENQFHCTTRIFTGFGQLPFRQAGNAMHPGTFAGSEPWKTNRNAPANCFVSGEETFMAQKNQGRLAVFLELRQVGAVRINFRRAKPAGDVNFRKAGRAGHNLKASGQLKSL
jgi:hypothetical protein